MTLTFTDEELGLLREAVAGYEDDLRYRATLESDYEPEDIELILKAADDMSTLYRRLG